MKTTVLGVRRNDYQRNKLKALAGDKELEADVVRKLIDDKIEGRILDCSGVIRAARKRKIDPQRFLDEIGKELARE